MIGLIASAWFMHVTIHEQKAEDPAWPTVSLVLPTGHESKADCERKEKKAVAKTFRPFTTLYFGYWECNESASYEAAKEYQDKVIRPRWANRKIIAPPGKCVADEDGLACTEVEPQVFGEVAKTFNRWDVVVVNNLNDGKPCLISVWLLAENTRAENDILWTPNPTQCRILTGARHWPKGVQVVMRIVRDPFQHPKKTYE